jgi:hypothetical protein
MQESPVAPILRGLEELQAEYMKAITHLKETRSFLTDIDIRITPFLKCFHVIQSTFISMDLFDKYVGEGSWWAAYFPEVTREQFVIAAHEFDRFHRLAFLHLFHFAIDSSLRTISKTISHSAIKSGTGKSKDLNLIVLHELKLEKYLCVLCIIRLLRNVGHNNGTYTGNTVTLQFRGKPYVFEKDNEPIFYGWLLFIEIAQEVKNLLVDIANSDKLGQSAIADRNAISLQQFHRKLFGIQEPK